MPDSKTAIVTRAQQGIAAALVEAFLNKRYNVVATSRNVTQSLPGDQVTGEILRVHGGAQAGRW
ncbi:MAG: hypothetical protein WBQ08_20500 [Candidatus Sulfotelmatobacter sp.]